MSLSRHATGKYTKTYWQILRKKSLSSNIFRKVSDIISIKNICMALFNSVWIWAGFVSSSDDVLSQAHQFNCTKLNDLSKKLLPPQPDTQNTFFGTITQLKNAFIFHYVTKPKGKSWLVRYKKKKKMSAVHVYNFTIYTHMAALLLPTHARVDRIHHLCRLCAVWRHPSVEREAPVPGRKAEVSGDEPDEPQLPVWVVPCLVLPDGDGGGCAQVRGLDPENGALADVSGVRILQGEHRRGGRGACDGDVDASVAHQECARWGAGPRRKHVDLPVGVAEHDVWCHYSC